MATKTGKQHPGLFFRPTQETKAVLVRYAALLGVSMSRLVSDLLESQRDVLSQMADIHEQALKLKDGQHAKVLKELEAVAKRLSAGKKSRAKKK